MFQKREFKKKRLALIVSSFCAVTMASSNASAALEEIVVTATKRAQSAQSVPLAITALSANALAERGISETSDLSGSMPNLIVSSPFGRTQPNFSIRGISVANEYNANAASPIGFYVNEDYKQFRPTHGMQLFDLERLEVIRGPQGTLFGRNTTGGAISLITKKPEFGEVGEFTGYVSAKVGNYNRVSVNAATETTLIEDKLAVRLAVTANKADGYIKNRTPDTIPTALAQAGAPAAALAAFGLPSTNTVNIETREDYASTDDQAVRLSVSWAPTDSFSAELIATHGESDPYGTAIIIKEVANGGQTDVFGYSRNGLDDDEAALDSNGKNETSADDVTLTLKWDVTENISMTSITGYLDGDYLMDAGDCDGLPILSCDQRFSSVYDQFNQDLRLSWDGDRAKAIVGLYYGEDSISSNDDKTFYSPLADFAGIPTFGFAAIAGDTSGAFPAGLQAQAGGIAQTLTAAGQSAYPSFNPPVIGWIGSGSFIGDPTNPLLSATGWGSNSSYTQERESTAIYFEGSYAVTDKANVTLGLRYTEDEFSMNDLRATFYDTAGNAQFNSIPFSLTPDENLVAAPLAGSSEEVTGRLIVDYQLESDAMLFASYSKGYRAGTFNGSATQTISQASFVKPEFIDNYELGIKSRMFDGNLQLNATLYYADYEDQQIQEVIGATTFLRNASGSLKGLEVEVEWQATEALYLSAGLGLSDSEYDEGQYFASATNLGANCIGGTSTAGAAFESQCLDIGGNAFPFAPDVNANVYLEWTAANLDKGNVVVSLTGRYQDDVWFDSFNDLKSRQLPPSSMMQEAYSVLDGRISFQAENYTVALWSKNLTDKYYNSYGIDTAGGFGFDFLVRGEPRTFGVDVLYNF